MTEQIEKQKVWNRIVTKAWADEDYKKRLMSEPAKVLVEEGMTLPEGLDIKVVEATNKQAWLVLPPKPVGTDIEEDDERLAAFPPIF